ncbi:hypothetical protein FEM48_Zijuj02G0191300 [Ziziphus jujuba var. spinosa]|uniref:Uncharacterized protein n=1 Tax=Ziziphus jujuba var. spinosa TaxID=714518 RepID=A0A978VXG1_ZIZJJ|nr:hypothetical protein FEM48_Zijuj02G0191300 [Ziziphus jujuba var. spinosa]
MSKEEALIDQNLQLLNLIGAMEMKRERFVGWVFIVIGSISFLGFVYAAVLSKLLPHSDNAIISSIQNDCLVYYFDLKFVTSYVGVIEIAWETPNFLATGNMVKQKKFLPQLWFSSEFQIYDEG